MEPVGVPLDPETAMVTESDCAVVMVEAAGVTVTVGVVGWVGWMEVELDPPPHPAIAMQAAATAKSAEQRAIVLISRPFSKLRTAQSKVIPLCGLSVSGNANCRGKTRHGRTGGGLSGGSSVSCWGKPESWDMVSAKECVESTAPLICAVAAGSEPKAVCAEKPGHSTKRDGMTVPLIAHSSCRPSFGYPMPRGAILNWRQIANAPADTE